MPTGYTAGISEGQNFDDFIMGCARAFGACIMMRDKPHSTSIPEKFEECSYEKKKYEESVLELEKYKNMPIKICEKKAKEEYKNLIKEREKSIKDKNKKEKLYESMLAKVHQWIPPSPDHEELKSFMIQQIDTSMDKGWTEEYYSTKTIIELSGEQWKHQKIKGAEENIEYYMKRWMEETERTAGRNKWVKQLRDNIK